VSAIKQRGHGQVGDSNHSVRLNLGRCLGLGQDAVARIQTSATTGDLQQEASSAVIVEAEVLIAQRFDVEALGDEDFGFNDYGTAGFLLKVSRRGTGLDTSYSVLPKTKAPTKVETNGMVTVSDLTVTSLLDGGHLFVQAAAEFKTEAGAEEAEF